MIRGFDVIDNATNRVIASSFDVGVACLVAKFLSDRPEGVDLVGYGFAAFIHNGDVVAAKGAADRADIRALLVEHRGGSLSREG